MDVRGPLTGLAEPAERVLRSLPDWFGIEESLIEYAQNTNHLPTFACEENGAVVGFLSLREHFTNSWEIDCIAVESRHRGTGVGGELVARAEAWLIDRGANFLQVKTLAPSHPSRPYAETRKFYECVGFQRLEVLPGFWGETLPVLVYIKALEDRRA